MKSRSSAHLISGVAFAVLATFCWAANFLKAYVKGAYSAWDFVTVQFLFAGAVGAILCIIYRSQIRRLGTKNILSGMLLGVYGYLGYSSCIMGGVIYGGAVVTPSFVGLVPVIVAIMGNVQKKTVPWSRLYLPLALVFTGLVLTNASQVNGGSTQAKSFGIGILFSIGAVLMWLEFSYFNQKALVELPTVNLGAWTALMLSGSGLGIIAMIPFGIYFGTYNLPSLGWNLTVSGHMYGYAFVLAFLSSVVGAWAWNHASYRLPVVLSGQLVCLETLFAILLGLIAEQRYPSVPETGGVMLLIIGVTLSVRAVLTTRRNPQSLASPG